MSNLQTSVQDFTSLKVKKCVIILLFVRKKNTELLLLMSGPGYILPVEKQKDVNICHLIDVFNKLRCMGRK